MSPWISALAHGRHVHLLGPGQQQRMPRKGVAQGGRAREGESEGEGEAEPAAGAEGGADGGVCERGSARTLSVAAAAGLWDAVSDPGFGFWAEAAFRAAAGGGFAAWALPLRFVVGLFLSVSLLLPLLLSAPLAPVLRYGW